MHFSQVIALLVVALGFSGPLTADPPGWPRFEIQEIETGLKIGYAVILEDLNGDQKPDIIVVDQHRVVWYENPTWKQRTIITGKTRPDNVCITALDITGDGKLELVLGAGWRPADTKNPGTLHWLQRSASLDDEWTLHDIPCDEPTVHRVRAMDITGDGKPEVVMVPLQGREASAAGNFTNGRPVRVIAYAVPKDPTVPANWKPQVICDQLHVMHNFCRVQGKTPEANLLVTSYEGVFGLRRTGEKWTTIPVGTGEQSNPKGSRGASEINMGQVAGKPFIATIEPWHGNQVVVYTPPADPKALWTRQVLDNQLRWGHAVSVADLDGDGHDDLIIGVRDDPNPKAGDKHSERRGVRLYRAQGSAGKAWDRQLLDPGSVAVEDLAVADLNGDGKPDIVAVGRATGNARIYWNRGK